MCSHKCVFVFWHTQGCAWVQCIFSLTQLCVGVCVCSHVRLTWVWPLLYQAGWLGVFFPAALSHKQVGLGLSITGASFAAALLPHCHMSRPGRSARLGCVVTSQARPGRSTTQAGPVVSQHYLCRSTTFAAALALPHCHMSRPRPLGLARLGSGTASLSSAWLLRHTSIHPHCHMSSSGGPLGLARLLRHSRAGSARPS